MMEEPEITVTTPQHTYSNKAVFHSQTARAWGQIHSGERGLARGMKDKGWQKEAKGTSCLAWGGGSHASHATKQIFQRFLP